jgi:UDP-3-O-[3-hydroxymyristoyl] glucosamine N-acyltransferase
MNYSVEKLASALGLPFHGDGSRLVTRVSSWQSADAQSLVFLEKDSRAAQTPTGAVPGCVVGPAESSPAGLTVIISERPKLDFARAAALLRPRRSGSGLRHPSAIVSTAAQIADSADLGPYVTIAAGARIGSGCVLASGVTVGEDCEIGDDCSLHAHVVLYPGVRLGNRVILHAGVVVGSDGFGYVFDGQAQIPFPQVGTVVIEDDVEIGSNSTIDRGSLGTTVIRSGAKIDNLVQIAHNVDIGRAVVIAAQTGISGSSVIEDNAVIGGQVGFGDHTRVQKGAVIGSKAGILPGKIVRSGDIYWGVPIRPLSEYKRLNALFGRLPEFKKDLDDLKQAVGRLQEALEKQAGPH